jgi:RND family efflux transporter MFP subunit
LSEDSKENQSGTWLWLMAGLAAVLAGGGVYYWLLIAGATESGAPSAPAAPLVRVAQVELLDEIEIRQTGFVNPQFAVDVAPDVTGRIVTVHDAFVLGARVTEGAALISLRRDRFEADLNQAEAAVDQGRAAVAQATAAFNRQSELAESDFASQARLDEASVGREQASAQLALAIANRRQAQLALDDTVVTAPYEAVVIAADASEGQIISAGMAVGRIVAAAAVEVSVGLTPSDVALVGSVNALIGTRVDLFAVDAPERLLASGTITKVDPQISATTRTANVVVEIRDPFSTQEATVRLGELVDVVISVAREDQTFSVPAAALKTSGRLWEVTPDGTLRAHTVSVINRRADIAAIQSDTLPKDGRVLLTDLPAPFEGQSVRVDTPQDAAAGAD